MGGGHLSRPDFGMPQPNPDHPLTEFYQLLQRGLDREGVFALPALYAAFQAPARRIYADEAADYLTLSETPAESRTLLLPPRMLQILYSSLHVLPDGTPDYDGIKRRAGTCRMAYIQRSRGYSLRPSLSIEVIAKICEAVRSVNPDCVIFTDNCYGELVEEKEPVSVGADLIAGSLIKNLGGGIAETGGYIAGRADLVELCAFRLTTPGTGKEVGASLNQLRGMYLGIFHAPEAVCAALKTAAFAAALAELLGFEAFPKYSEKRTDIIEALKLGGEKQLIAFCQGIQAGSPVDSFASPEPWDMPGYDSQVIMAAGAFTMGASIELSADAPLREPFAVWLQGGLTFPTGKAGIMHAAQYMLDKGLAHI